MVLFFRCMLKLASKRMNDFTLCICFPFSYCEFSYVPSDVLAKRNHRCQGCLFGFFFSFLNWVVVNSKCLNSLGG